MRDLPSLQALIQQLRHIPYVASKQVYRVALYLLTAPDERAAKLVEAIAQARSAVAPCELCGNWAEKSVRCTVCSDVHRDANLLCVVEQWPDLYAIERLGEYRGRYHVLGGVLSPLEGIGPDQLRISQLVQRLTQESIREIIFAINPTPEGEATMSYIRTKMPKDGPICSRLASGMPTGSHLAYLDRTTIHRALAGRQPLL
ncbi:MAG: recombination protein RecR [Candidatus Dependentiae bacterium]|nr:recombination protein RecR [Candidatus Dependentiae bacterium]